MMIPSPISSSAGSAIIRRRPPKPPETELNQSALPVPNPAEEEIGLGIIMLSHVNDERKTAEIYIKLKKEARGRGYGRGAVALLLSRAFGELGLRRVCANILEHNAASLSLFEACGFQREHVQNTRADREGHCQKVYGYGISREDWEEIKACTFSLPVL